MDGKLGNVASLFASALGEKEDRFDALGRHVNDGNEWTAAKNMALWCKTPLTLLLAIGSID